MGKLNKKLGIGRLEEINSTLFEGQWVNNNMTGYGRVIDALGNVY